MTLSAVNSEGKQRVQRLMQQHGIRARGKRRFRIATTDSRHSLPIAPNLLDHNAYVSLANCYFTSKWMKRTARLRIAES